MKRGEAQQSLIATNRWWRDPERWPLHDPDLRDVGDAPFRYQAGVLSNLTPGGLYVLRGPRRVGKTVEVKLAIRNLIAGGTEPRRIAHMAVDGLRSRDLGVLIDAAGSLMPEGVRRFWFFDEITGITDGWPERIKWLRDNDTGFRTDTIVLTGSSAADLTAATKALAGRRGGAVDSDRVLLPIGFRSFLRLSSAEPPPEDAEPLGIDDLTPARLAEFGRRLAPWLDVMIRGWETYLRVGGFPSAVASHVASREEAESLRASLADVIHGDAFSRASWSRAQTTDLLRRLAARLCAPVNVASMANDIGVAQTTLKHRLDELREAFVLWPCHREDGLRPKLGAQAKLYFTDPVYARLAPSIGFDLPRLSQQQLGMALLRASERAGPGAHVEFDRVLHHRTRTRKEIDFVGPGFGGVGIESKYVDGSWRRDALTLKASPWRGIIATRSELDLAGPEVVAAPAALLAWLIDS